MYKEYHPHFPGFVETFFKKKKLFKAHKNFFEKFIKIFTSLLEGSSSPSSLRVKSKQKAFSRFYLSFGCWEGVFIAAFWKREECLKELRVVLRKIITELFECMLNERCGNQKFIMSSILWQVRRNSTTIFARKHEGNKLSEQFTFVPRNAYIKLIFSPHTCKVDINRKVYNEKVSSISLSHSHSHSSEAWWWWQRWKRYTCNLFVDFFFFFYLILFCSAAAISSFRSFLCASLYFNQR